MTNSIMETLRPKDFSYVDVINLMSKRENDERISSGRHKWLFEELKNLLEFSDSHEWQIKEGELFEGDVQEQYIGTVYHKHTKHVFTCLYVGPKSQILRHGHMEFVGTGWKKTSEFYVFPDGLMELCRKNEKHDLENISDEPMYVVSVKITGRGYRRAS